MPANILEENSRQMDWHKKRLVFRTLIGDSEVCAGVHALCCCRAKVTAPLNKVWYILYSCDLLNCTMKLNEQHV